MRGTALAVQRYWNCIDTVDVFGLTYGTLPGAALHRGTGFKPIDGVIDFLLASLLGAR